MESSRLTKPLYPVKYMKNRATNGFSLIEVVVFVGILSLFFVAGLAVATYFIRVTKSNENKILATQYGEELMEWMKAQKEINWGTFVTAANAAGGITYYCFNSDDIKTRTDFPSPYGDCLTNDYTLHSLFKRNVKLTASGTPTNTVEITINVQWKEPTGTASVPLHSFVTLWEQ